MRAVGTPVGELPADPLGSAAGLRGAVLLPAGTGARLLHAVVDVAVLALLLMVPVLLSVVGAVLSEAPLEVALLACAIASAVVLVGVTVVWPAADGGRTAGMRWTGLRVVDRWGRPARPHAILLRTLLVPVDLVVGGPLVLLRDDRRRLGDLLARTQVVRDTVGTRAPARPVRSGTAVSRTTRPRRP